MQPEERKRYSRQIIMPEIGLSGQEKLLAAKVLVVGAGGLGCPVLQYLTAAGVGTLGIVDDDMVDISNLHRQILYSADDIGKSKAVTAAAKLTILNPNCTFLPISQRINEKNAEDIIRDFDLVIDGSDNFPTRYILNDACLALNKPWIFGSILRFEGQVSVFNYQNGPSYRSLFPDAEEGENCAEAGVLGILPGIIGTYMANEAVKIICQTGETLSGKLMIINTLTNETNIFKFGNAATASNQTPAQKKVDTNTREMSSEEFEQVTETHPDDYFLVDVREEYEFEEDAIGGVNIPLPDLSASLDQIPSHKNIVFYCRSGKRSKNAADLLLKSGYSGDIFWMKE